IRSDFAKNVLTLITGTSIAQLIPILITPILTRIYSPAQLGELATFLSTVAILTNIATFRYEQAIVLPKQKKEAFKLFFFCVINSITLSLIIFGIVFFLKDTIPFQNTSVLYLIPLGIVANSIFLAANNLSNRNQNYRNMAVSKISDNTASSAIQLGGGQWILSSGITLVLGKIIGTVVGSFILLRKIFYTKNNKYLRLLFQPTEIF